MTRPFATTLHLRDIAWAGRQLHISWGVDDLTFTTTVWYDTVDFHELERRQGREVVEWLAFHVAMFEVNKGVSFGPEVLTVPARWQDHLTEDLCRLWRTVTRRIWAQWRYEHDLPDYEGPALEPTSKERRRLSVPVPLPERAVDSLWFCGGGKDSLLASHVLDEVGTPYDAIAYSHSVYGPVQRQLSFIDPVIDSSRAHTRHRMYFYDTASDLPLADVRPYRGVRRVLAGETPASLFASLPIVLAHGYRNLIFAHERSANVGNMLWPVTGEDVNHQWGKSLEAERLLGEYVWDHLSPEVKYFSILQPVHDAVVFASLREIAELLPRAHSCNVAKPWCKRCAKCAYVWISYKAWLPWGPVDQAFGNANLLDDPENEVWFRGLLGLAEHTPFECIGQVAETRLAFAMARARGLTGRAMALVDEYEPIDARAVLDRYLHVEACDHRLPAFLADDVVRFFQLRASEADRYATGVLSG